MSPEILPWLTCAGALLLAILCLPVASIARLVVEVSTWVLRLALFGLLALGGYLWLRPADMPAAVSNALNNLPELLALLPDRSAPHFALCAACIVVAALVPLLAVLEVTRRVVAPRVREVTTVAAAPVAEAIPEPALEPVSVGVPVMRPIDRRTAAGTITSVWSRRPARTR
jgi:hypothetical protein